VKNTNTDERTKTEHTIGGENLNVDRASNHRSRSFDHASVDRGEPPKEASTIGLKNLIAERMSENDDRASNLGSRSFERASVDPGEERPKEARTAGQENLIADRMSENVDRASSNRARSFERVFVDPEEERWNADHQAAESGIARTGRELSPARSLARPRVSEPVKFVAYDVALELIRALAPVVKQIARHSADLADQIVRAASSITLNLSEGSGRRGKDRKRFFLFAQGSAKEIRGALDTASVWGWRIDAEAAYALLDRELRLLWGLCR